MTLTLNGLIDRLPQQRVLVVGDAILDEYIYGQAERLSREAPVPVLSFTKRDLIPGGAANPAVTVASLGAASSLVSVAGMDTYAAQLHSALVNRGVRPHLVGDAERPTTLKTRIMAQSGLRFPQQVARIDTLARANITADLADKVAAVADSWLATVDALLCSDYRSGTLTPELVALLRDHALARGLLLSADAQGDFEKYAGFGLMKCNAEEVASYLGSTLETDAEFAAAADALRLALHLTVGMVITRGADGMTYASENLTGHVPAPRVADVFDTVGAGDTAVAVLTLACAAGATLAQAARLANFASGIVVRHVGNYAPTLDELRAVVKGD